jgi:hypothetical protein
MSALDFVSGFVLSFRSPFWICSGSPSSYCEQAFAACGDALAAKRTAGLPSSYARYSQTATPPLPPAHPAAKSIACP